VDFDYSAGLLRPHRRVEFKASGGADGVHYHWIFGDGSEADGRIVHHKYPDAEGTLLDSSGRFRVLLHVTDEAGHQAWKSRSIVVASDLRPASAPHPNQSAASGERVFDRQIGIPRDGGYTFTLLTSTQATLSIDDLPPSTSPKPRAQVCGSPGNAVQPVLLSLALAAGPHHIRIVRDSGLENAASTTDGPVLYWEGPGLERQAIPVGAYLDAPQGSAPSESAPR
jgi:hypothetical protein